MRQSIEQMREQLGWQGTAGIALLLLAWAFNYLALKPLEKDDTFMHGRLEVARSRAAMQSRTYNLGSQRKELDVFFNSLPKEQGVTDILAAIYSAAEASGVVLKEGEYHLEDQDRPRVEYAMSFPVQGEYGKIREFVFKVLTDHPAIALDQIAFQRDKINDSTLKADIKFTLFLRPDTVGKQNTTLSQTRNVGT